MGSTERQKDRKTKRQKGGWGVGKGGGRAQYHQDWDGQDGQGEQAWTRWTTFALIGQGWAKIF